MIRKAISKGKRFAIFARDNFTCRYCGRQSDVVSMAVDHIIPVCQGGTNDEENLITACVDCNGGKGSKTLTQTVPTEADRLRLAQERNEQLNAARAVSEAAKARTQMRQEVVNFWCGCTGKATMSIPTLNVIMRCIEEFGVSNVFPWIEKASAKCRDDVNMGKYISGIRRNVLEKGHQDA